MAKKSIHVPDSSLPIEKHVQVLADLNSHITGIRKALSFFSHEERRRLLKDISLVLGDDSGPGGHVSWSGKE
jgi:hypothetical protein